jgi:hypothetical protein
MPQTSTIAFALIIGFIVYITVRGQLPGYLGVIGLGSQPVASPATQSSTAVNVVGKIVGALAQ